MSVQVYVGVPIGTVISFVPGVQGQFAQSAARVTHGKQCHRSTFPQAVPPPVTVRYLHFCVPLPAVMHHAPIAVVKFAFLNE